MKREYILLIVLGVVILLILWCMHRKKEQERRRPAHGPARAPPRENFTSLASGAIDNIGALVDDSYQLLPGADNDVPAINYADLVDQGDLPKEMQPRSEDGGLKPMERLERIQGSGMMPRVSTSVTPHAVNIADAAVHMFMVNAPRASTALKSPYKDYHMSTFIRGDIPIRYIPTICHIAKTRQGVDDQTLDGLFTPHFNQLYNQLTGKAYKNLPIHIAGAGTGAGAQAGVIMDNN